MATHSRFADRLRRSRDAREFYRALRNASPAMQQELVAAAARQATINR